MLQSKYQRIHAFLIQHDQPAYRAGQIFNAIFAQRTGAFQAMRALPASLRTALEDEFGPSILGISPVTESQSAQARKVLFTVGRNQRVESVLMHYRAGWQSLCISTQSGCGMGCRFCATGAIGFQRNLSADEITDQYLYFHLAGQQLAGLSFMGMGEPLANPESFAALALLTDPALFKLGQRRITVSTVGVLPGIEQLIRQFPQVNLVFSLHSPFEEQRSELIPLNDHYPLAEILPLLDRHVRRSHRQVSIAYLLLKGVNDSLDHAAALIDLFGNRIGSKHLYHFNLIRYHPTQGAPAAYAPPDEAQIQAFAARVRGAGFNVTRRPSFGKEIDAACGQLHGRYQSRNQ